MTDFTEGQLAAIATLTSVYPAGIEVSPADAEVCESLVATGHAVRIEGDDYEGRGYQLSPQMAEAHHQVIADRADRAGQN